MHMTDAEAARTRTLMTEMAALTALVSTCRDWGMDAEQVARIAANLHDEFVATLKQEAAA